MASHMYARYVPPKEPEASRVSMNERQFARKQKRSVHNEPWNPEDAQDQRSPKKVKTKFGALDSKLVNSITKGSRSKPRAILNTQEIQDPGLETGNSAAVESLPCNNKGQKKAKESSSKKDTELDGHLHDCRVKKKARMAPYPDDTDEKEDLFNADKPNQSEQSHTNVNEHGVNDHPIRKQNKNRRRPANQDSIAKDDESSVVPRTEDQEDIDGKHREILAKYHKSTAKAKKHTNKRSDVESLISSVNPTQTEDAEELAGLMPLPQPAPVDDTTAEPAFSALPSWLEHPILVSSAEKRPLERFQINSKLLSLLKNRGYTEAFAVQSAVIPLLSQGPEKHDGDVCISAATGSGKTLAYALPLVESLRDRVVTRLRGLIVVPTRELVLQAREVCEMCCSGSGLKVHTAVGSRSFKAEQEELIERSQRYDPLTAERHQSPLNRTGNHLDYDFGMDDEFDDMDKILPGHVIEYQSRVDILICSPGRLVDHIRTTPGFTLEYVQWLVIDEADKLLSQTFQGWMDVVMGSLERQKSPEEFSLGEKVLHKMGLVRPPKPARKVILSATMTRDLSKLSALHLRNPKLVVLDNVGSIAFDEGLHPEEVDAGAVSQETYDLPFSLQEWTIPAGDGGDKPLYLLQLLQNNILKRNDSKPSRLSRSPLQRDSPSSAQSSTNEDFGSSHDSEKTASSSESDDASLSSSDSANRLSTPEPLLVSNQEDFTKRNHGVLIFTKSNESAIRLTRLLTLLHPPYRSVIGTLTSTHSSTLRRKTLRYFASMKLSILIASDLVARGLDIANLAHVINYDLPTSVRGYVHRVGRTARAGREGEAWSLVTDKEARWFWNAIARGKELRRPREKKVARYRMNLESLSEEEKSKYEEALRTLGEEVRGSR